MICRVCDSENLELAVDLGDQPWCNNFLALDQVGLEPLYRLRVVFCRDCRTAQLDYTVAKEVMFSDHTYVSGTTKSLGAHFARVAEEVQQRFFLDAADRSVLDIGSNDGTQLDCYKRLGYDVLGIESCSRVAQIALDAGIPTVCDFFNLDLAKKLSRKFDIINAAGVFFHLEELHSVTEGIRYLLEDDGIFVVQFLYMKRIVENLAFDQIYHEHLLFYNLATIEYLLNRHGLAMFDAYLAPIHGGSVMGFVSHQGKRQPSDRLADMRRLEDRDQANELSTYKVFAERVRGLRDVNREYLSEANRQGKTVYGLGAPAKGTTLLNYFGILPSQMPFLVERNPLRDGLFCPGVHIPIVLEEALKAPPDIYYVLAWNFKDEILARNQNLIDRGVEFYFPIEPRPVEYWT